MAFAKHGLVQRADGLGRELCSKRRHGKETASPTPQPLTLRYVVRRPHLCPFAIDPLAGDQPVGALDHHRPGDVGLPVVGAVLKAEFAVPAILNVRQSLAVTQHDDRRRIREEVRIGERKDERFAIVGDGEIGFQLEAGLQPPDNTGQPTRAFFKRSDGVSLGIHARGALQDPDHPNPAGLVGARAWSGKT